MSAVKSKDVNLRGVRINVYGISLGNNSQVEQDKDTDKVTGCPLEITAALQPVLYRQKLIVV